MAEYTSKQCSICGSYRWPDGDHNAQPINNGRCCGICNAVYVIPTRMERLAHGLDPRKVEVADE